MRNTYKIFIAKTIFILVALCLLINLNIYSQSKTDNSTISKFNIKEFKLSNGFTVILNEDHTESKVFGVVITKAGGKNDPKDATGMAHYQEHMLFKGTQDLGTTNWEKEKPHIDKIFELYDLLGKTSNQAERKKIQTQINEESIKANEYVIPNELSNIIKGIGGTMLNAGTGPDVTMFYNQFPPNQIEKWIEIYSHRFINPVFRSFQAELEVVYEEKNMYSDNFIMGILDKFLFQFFKKHPYGQQTIIGTVDDLKNPSLTKMYQFFKTYYVANNMALILCGDFNTKEVIPLIEKNFGKLPNGEVPKPIVYKEEPFNGREFVEANLSPIKLGLLGFRTPPNGDNDEIVMKVCNTILFNQNETGLLNKLQIDNKLLATGVFSLPYNDYGATIFFLLPKIVGQSLKNAEELVLAEIEKIKKGDFEDWMMEAAKNQLYKEYLLSLENLQTRAVLIAQTFGEKKNINDIILYPEKIKSITKNDVIQYAQKYFGKKYLALYSKMGFPKKQKIEKPGYQPIIQKNNDKSSFAKHLDSIEVYCPILKYIDFKTDIETSSINNNIKLYYTPNSLNDIFSLKIKWGIGEYNMPMLKYISQIMNYAGTKNKNVFELKREFDKLGCSYSFSSNDSYLILTLQGLDRNFEKSISLVNELINQPVLDKTKLNILIDGEKGNRKIERSEPDNIAEALLEYVKYKNRSDFLTRLTINELKKLNVESMVAGFCKATNYEAEIHCSSALKNEFVKIAIKDNLLLAKNPIKTESPIFKPVEKYTENIIYLVDKKKAVQSKIYFFANGNEFNLSMEPYIEAFNLYFGGDFSGLVLQEIREYRSMAYSAGAKYSIPSVKGKPSEFVGYVGTQADKTIDAIEIFYNLIKNMPEKTERLPMVKQFLLLTAITNRPNFRDLSESFEKWIWSGYTDDPAKIKNIEYNKITFNDIIQFYKNNIQEKPIVIAIVGNKKQIDEKKLSKYGKIIELPEKELFRD